MMKNLPMEIRNFVLWYLIGFPKKIYKVSNRLLILTNNSFSLTLNVRLFFTPLFGDYTIIGRLMGFVYRIIKILVGGVILLVLFAITIFLPTMWFLIPFILFYYIKLWTILVLIFLFAAWELSTTNVPDKRVSQVKAKNAIKSFRPATRANYRNLCSRGNKALLVFFNEPDIKILLKRLELHNKGFVKKVHSSFKLEDKESLLKIAYDYATVQETRYVELEHLFLSILKSIPNYEILLSSVSSNMPICEGAVRWIVSGREELSKIYFWQDDYRVPYMGGVNRGMTGRITRFLDSVSDDYTEMAKYGKFRKLVGREEEIKEVADILSGAAQVNVLIIGEPGSGKSSIIKALSNLVIKGTKYKSLEFKRIVALDIGRFMSGAKTPGEIAEKMTKALDEAEDSGDVILFIDEIHNLVGGAGTEEVSLASAYSMLEPRLSSGKIQFIGATSIENYRKYVEPNGAFARLFEIVDLKEASSEDTMEILKVRSRDMEKNYKIMISYPALDKTIELSQKLIHERVFPDKALEILGRTAVSRARAKGYLSSEDVAEEISQITHVPVTAISEDESERLLKIEEEMKKMVVGQDPALTKVAAALKRARVGIRNRNRPIASFLFVGTTGVGKTQTAKALAKAYFGGEKAMIRLDMSEYQQPDSINKLIGTPGGRSKGQLTDAVRSSPFSLILLDEFEKAYSEVLLAFLQVLDDGRLTDSVGHVVDFTNTIIIATSNVGTRKIQEVSEKGGDYTELSEVAIEEIRSNFAPELLNRFSSIIVYRPLSIENVRKISRLLLENVSKMAKEKNIKVMYKLELIDELVKRGYNPQWGARPLARVIEDTVETFLADKILSFEFKPGDVVTLGAEVFED